MISFVIDATSSMSTDINKAHESVQNIINNKKITKKLRVCYYRDHCDKDFLTPYGGLAGGSFTTDLEAIRRWMIDKS